MQRGKQQQTKYKNGEAHDTGREPGDASMPIRDGYKVLYVHIPKSGAYEVTLP